MTFSYVRYKFCARVLALRVMAMYLPLRHLYCEAVFSGVVLLYEEINGVNDHLFHCGAWYTASSSGPIIFWRLRKAFA